MTPDIDIKKATPIICQVVGVKPISELTFIPETYDYEKEMWVQTSAWGQAPGSAQTPGWAQTPGVITLTSDVGSAFVPTEYDITKKIDATQRMADVNRRLASSIERFVNATKSARILFGSSFKTNVNFLLLKGKYEAEVRNNSLRNISWDDTFDVLARQLSAIEFEKASIEITPRESIKFTFALGDSRILMVSKSLNKFENENGNIVIFSMFIDHELIVSDALELTEFVEGIKKYLTV